MEEQDLTVRINDGWRTELEDIIDYSNPKCLRELYSNFNKGIKIKRYIDHDNGCFWHCVYIDLIDALEKTNLTEKQRVCLEYMIAGWSNTEIAEMLDVTDDAIKHNIEGAVKKIRKYLTE